MMIDKKYSNMYPTLLWSGYEWPKDEVFVSSDNQLISYLIRRSGHGWLFPFPLSWNGNNPIYPFLSTCWIWNNLEGAMPIALYEYKVHKGLIFTTSNEVIWLKNNFMHGLKGAIFAIFKKGWYGTFWPLHEISNLFGPTDFIWSGKE